MSIIDDWVGFSAVFLSSLSLLRVIFLNRIRFGLFFKAFLDLSQVTAVRLQELLDTCPMSFLILFGLILLGYSCVCACGFGFVLVILGRLAHSEE